MTAVRRLRVAGAHNWMVQAACIDSPDLFHPTVDVHSTYQLARRYCMSCPVAADCLNDAMDAEGDLPGSVRHGMRGGLTPDQRADLHRHQPAIRLRDLLLDVADELGDVIQHTPDDLLVRAALGVLRDAIEKVTA